MRSQRPLFRAFLGLAAAMAASSLFALQLQGCGSASLPELTERPSGAAAPSMGLSERPSDGSQARPPPSGAASAAAPDEAKEDVPGASAAAPALAERTGRDTSARQPSTPAPTASPQVIAVRPTGDLRASPAPAPTGREGPDRAAALLKEAEAHRIKGEYRLAEPLYNDALNQLLQERGEDDPLVATVLNDLGEMYRESGAYGSAEPLVRRALAIRERKLGRDDLATAATTDDLAWLLWQRGDYAGAEPLAQRALDIRKAKLGEDHPTVARSLTTLGVLLWEKGEYARAEPLLARAVAIEERAHGGKFGGRRSQTALAARTTEGSKPALAEALDGGVRSDLAVTLDNLGGLYLDKGDFKRAEPLFRRALAIEEAERGSEDPAVAIPLSYLALTFQEREELDRAEPFYQRALRIWEKALGPEHPKVAIARSNLGELYLERGDHALAEPLFLTALDIFKKALGPEHPLVAGDLDDLSVLYRETGDLKRARPLAERALTIRQKAFGKGHPAVAEAEGHLALLALAEGNISEAVDARRRGAAIEDDFAALLLTIGSEDQKRAFMVKLQKSTDETISLHALRAPADREAARLALTTILQRKGRVLDAMTDSFEALRRRLDLGVHVLFERLAKVDAQLGALVLRGQHKMPALEYQANLAALEAERQSLETQVSARSAAFRAEQRPVTIEEVQQAIPEGTALVEMFVFSPFDERASTPSARRRAPRYAAYLLRRRGDPSFVDLGDAAAIDDEVVGLRAALADPGRDPRPKARALDARVMQPIRAALGGTSQVLLSPDGALNLIPFGALVDEDGRYLIERASFTYVTSGRELLRREAPVEPRQGPMVFADPAFGPVEDSPPPGGPGRRSVDMGDVRFGRLPGTALEGAAVGKRVAGARLLVGAEATESAVKKLHGPSVVHIATHGFFLPSALGAKGSGGPASDRARAAGATRIESENPLLRAGLAFAGANQRESGADDGVLTALEASSLDLRGTRLIVLSACETGVGEAGRGEGIYGLRRALVIAGAETQVMSLWKVDDDGTRKLMEAYYTGLDEGGGRSEALRKAQLGMLASRSSAHPYYWASFVVSGNGEPLFAPPRGVGAVRPGPRGCSCEAAGERGDLGGGVVVALGAVAVLGRRRRRAL